MAGIFEVEPHTPGFNFDNCKRNNFLEIKGITLPKAQKTGTTIVGIIIKDGLILGADTRATEDTIVADKYSKKIHYLSKNMYCCGAGTAADTEMTCRSISSQLELLRLNTGRVVPVCAANRLLKQLLFRYQGYIGAALVLGGVDNTGPHLYCIHPHGSTDTGPFASMGSGSLAAMAFLESHWKPGLSVEEGKLLVRNAIAAGIFNDLGSGNNIDMCVMHNGSVDYICPYEEANIKGKRQGNYRFAKGTTAVLHKKVMKVPLIVEQEYMATVLPQSSEQPMDVCA